MQLRSLLFLLCLSMLAPAVRGDDVTLRFTPEGIQAGAGSVGRFTVEYPLLLGADQKPVRQLIEKTTTPGRALLRYDAGLEVEMTLGEVGQVAIRFSQAPPEVKSLEWNMHIPIAFNQGGRWQAGEREGDFPKEKPASPHLFQGHGSEMRITNYEGRTLVLTPPPNTFLQITDNREWNWAIFNFRGSTPFAADRRELTFAFAAATGPVKKAVPLVDALGQAGREEWPGKVKSLEELRADVLTEQAYYAALQPPPRGKFGGWLGSRERLGLQATGFFHLEKRGERWLLVDPAGDAFFHLGVCATNPSDDYTVVRGRESAYAWLPPREGEFATAWRKDSDGAIVSFHLANLIRKVGEPYQPERYLARMIERMRKWGFNSRGAFSAGGEKACEAAAFPSVAHLPLDPWDGVEPLPGIEQVWDPFDEKTRSRIVSNFARTLPTRRDDPLIIGYFISNEPIYENIGHIVPTLRGSDHACKRRFVQGLEAKYKTVAAFNKAWAAQAKTFAELADLVLPVQTQAAKADVQEYVEVFLEEYFRFVAETFRQHDYRHLLLGSRLMPGTIDHEPICRIMGKYVDVMSFNYYTHAIDQALLERIYKWTGGRPLMLSEFYWSATKESGLTGGREVATQKERGLFYRNYVEQSAALGFVVGVEWFTLIDQAVTGRWFQGFDGERANTGLLSVADRPWQAALAEMMKTNYGIYEVWLGEKPPFTLPAENP